MHVSKLQDNEITVTMSLDELIVINNALNEICNGIDIEEFESRIGARLDEVRSMLGIVGTAIDKATIL